MRNLGHSLALLGTWMLIPLGCSTADNVDLGATKGSALVDYAASWDGYAEAYKFDKTTSDRIRITLDANGNGTLEVGEQTLYPPPTDFDVGYPPGDAFPWGNNTHADRFRPGFRYPLHGTRIETGRLRLFVEPTDPFATWCEHQTPYKDTHIGYPPGDVYFCVSVPASTGPGPGGDKCAIHRDPPLESEVIDCGKLDLCHGVAPCACTASGCTSAHQGEDKLVQLDAALESAGTTMVGTLIVPASGYEDTARVTVRLTRN